ncbi:MAG: divergent polysaccharide deacetylase family protein [Treponema sp.]|nr:divergent polysaccharide deacetylase family protein [Treponema sp.]
MQRPNEKISKNRKLSISETTKQSPQKGSRKGKKPKNAIPDVLKAILLTASIIVAAIATSLVVINIRSVEPPQTVYLGTPHGPLPPEPPPRPDRGTLVFVIDDAGHNLHDLEPFLRFPGPLTIAVLPGLSHSVEAARRIREAGMEVFLHQPMEAIGGEDPGPGAIYIWMSDEEILEILNRNLAQISPVAGMNNHQGSRITADERIMETVLAFSREHGIPFLDSKTTAMSAAPAVARRMGITIGERNVFIDNQQDRPSMNRAIEEGLRIASQRGNAVMIGHVWSPELAPLLKELYQDLVDQGFTFATASQLINDASR